MFVVTADQQGSTGGTDRVPHALGLVTAMGGAVLPFERTVGDEIQGVFDDAARALGVVLALLRDGPWSVGLGLGSADEPLPTSTRAATGPAFLAARRAVERAKNRLVTVPVAVEGPYAALAADAEAVLRLLGATVRRRSARGWEVIDVLRSVSGNRKDVATRLGISEQAVSQRLRAALWAEEVAVRPVLVRMLDRADAHGLADQPDRED